MDPHYSYDQCPPFEPHEDAWLGPSRGSPPYFGDHGFGRPSPQPHHYRQQRPPVRPQHGHFSRFGRPERIKEDPSDVEWVIEFKPSSSSATPVSSWEGNHVNQCPTGPCARSPSHRDDALSTALGLLGLPVEKDECQTVSNCGAGSRWV